MKATDNFQTLSQAGIDSAHNAVTDERIEQLQSHISSLIDSNVTYDKALTDLALVVNTLKENQSSTATPAPAAGAPQNDMQTILAAITNLQQPTPVITKAKTEMQHILALLTANAGNKNGGGGNRGGGNGERHNSNNNNNNGNNNNNNNGGNNGGNNPNNRNGRRQSTTPNLRYKFYCWSHGVNPTHNSCQCTNNFPGHQNSAIYTNQMNGWQTNAPRWCGFVTP